MVHLMTVLSYCKLNPYQREILNGIWARQFNCRLCHEVTMHKTGVTTYYRKKLYRPVQLALFVSPFLMDFLNKEPVLVTRFIRDMLFVVLLIMVFFLLSNLFRRKPYLVLSDQGIGYCSAGNLFICIDVKWSAISRHVRLGKRENNIKFKYAHDLRSLNIPLDSLSEEDRKEFICKVKELIDQYGNRPYKDQTFNCFKCSKPINPEDNSCPSCGWKWS